MIVESHSEMFECEPINSSVYSNAWYNCITSLDPLVSYGHESGSGIIWSDTDRDGIPDVAEIYLANHSKWSTFKVNYL